MKVRKEKVINMKLTDREWKEFVIEDIFDIYTGATIKQDEFQEGAIPRITASDANNGVSMFTDNLGSQNYRKVTNFISISFLGSVFYQPCEVSLDMKIHGIKLKNRDFKENLALFLIPLIKQFTFKYNYGYQLSSSVLRKQKIMLPVDDNKNPDFLFMEQYVAEQTVIKKQKYISFVKETLESLEILPVVPLSDKEWRAFCIEDIFNISSGKRLIKDDMKPGVTPFIGATDSGNGITHYISNRNTSLDKNVLGVNYNGNGVTIGFYHPYECLFTDDVKRFHLKNHEDNRYVLLFFKTIILQQKSKYNYAYKFNEQRMRRQYIMVPVNDTGEPDYSYMEQYIKNITISKYQAYLSYSKA